MQSCKRALNVSLFSPVEWQFDSSLTVYGHVCPSWLRAVPVHVRHPPLQPLSGLRVRHHRHPVLPRPHQNLQHAGVVEVALMMGRLRAQLFIYYLLLARLVHLQDEFVLALGAAHTDQTVLVVIRGGGGAATLEVGTTMQHHLGGVEGQKVVSQR